MAPSPHNPSARRMSDGIRRVGFRKWYERELLSSHAHMVLALLSAIALAGSFEAFRGAPAQEKLMDVLFIVVCAVIGLWALRRYLFLLMRAEGAAKQAICAGCGAYGRFEILSEDLDLDETRVCCTRCSHQWTINA